MDFVANQGKKKKAKHMFCGICHKFNHKTVDCWRNPNNKDHGGNDNDNMMEGTV